MDLNRIFATTELGQNETDRFIYFFLLENIHYFYWRCFCFRRNAKLAGFVAVAPGSLDSLQENDLQTIEVSLIVCGTYH